MQKYFMQNRIHSSSTVLDFFFKITFPQKKKWNKLLTKLMSKNSKLEEKITNYLLTTNYSSFNKMIRAHRLTIPVFGGSIDIAHIPIHASL
jgi:hypothetical protein